MLIRLWEITESFIHLIQMICARNEKLLPYADVLTPNLTEACRILDLDYHKVDLSEEGLVAICEALSDMGPSRIVITGLQQGDLIFNYIFEKNMDYWKDFRASLEAEHPDVYLVGEVWEKNVDNVVPFLTDGGLHSVFDFNLSGKIYEAVSNETTAYDTEQASETNRLSDTNDLDIVKGLISYYNKLGEGSNYEFIDCPFITNHDQNRLISLLRYKFDETADDILTASVQLDANGNPVPRDDAEKADRGSDIILHIDDDCKEFLEKARIQSLLNKYCKFMPVPVAFGKKTEWKDGKQVETEEDNIINSVEPLWTKTPSTLKDKDYKKFYNELYPMQDEPLFWIHLNVDYPFNLTGILYFPRIKSNIELQRNKIQLYCNQVFVTDQVEGIVPEFLTLLHGVIDSPDIPLNVSRSYLQSDRDVKKISTYITKKVADRLNSIFKENRKDYESKWDDLKLFINYGMLSQEDFYDRAKDFAC